MNLNALSLEMQSKRVRIRPWQYQDDLTQRTWPRYSDPFNSLWNIARGNAPFYDTLFSSFSDTSIAYRIWAVEDIQSTLIGRISLRDIKKNQSHARLGISMGEPYLGQGLGSEALAVFLDYFFGPLGFKRMLLDVAAFNRRAVRCYERLGFRYLGQEWRKTKSDPCLRLLEDPSYQHLQPFFRRERMSVWVQFVEMELPKQEWLARERLSETVFRETETFY